MDIFACLLAHLAAGACLGLHFVFLSDLVLIDTYKQKLYLLVGHYLTFQYM